MPENSTQTQTIDFSMPYDSIIDEYVKAGIEVPEPLSKKYEQIEEAFQNPSLTEEQVLKILKSEAKPLAEQLQHYLAQVKEAKKIRSNPKENEQETKQSPGEETSGKTWENKEEKEEIETLEDSSNKNDSKQDPENVIPKTEGGDTKPLADPNTPPAEPEKPQYSNVIGDELTDKYLKNASVELLLKDMKRTDSPEELLRIHDAIEKKARAQIKSKPIRNAQTTRFRSSITKHTDLYVETLTKGDAKKTSKAADLTRQFILDIEDLCGYTLRDAIDIRDLEKHLQTLTENTK